MRLTTLKRSCLEVHIVSSIANTELTLGAVVLAGGQARRMGGKDKGLIEIGQRPMVSWVLDALKPVANQVVINANRNVDQYEQHGVPVIGDVIAEFPGPLAGLLSACEHLNTDWVLMCPCDSPFVTEDLINTLWQAARQADKQIVVAHDGSRLQPVFAAIDASLAGSLRAYLQRGDRKIDLWYAEEGFSSVNCSEYRSQFDNINTPEEKQAAEQLNEVMRHGHN